MQAEEYVYLNVPEAEFHMARALGVLWDPDRGAWCVPIGNALDHVARWLPSPVPGVDLSRSNAAPVDGGTPAVDPVGAAPDPFEFDDTPRSLHELAILGMAPHEPEPQPVVEPQPQPVPQPLPQPVVEPQSVPQSVPQPVVESQPQPVVESVPQPQPQPQPQPAAPLSFNPFGVASDPEGDDWVDEMSTPEGAVPPMSPSVIPVARPQVPAGPRIPAHVLGLRMQCARCLNVTTVVAGVGLPRSGAGGRRRRNESLTDPGWHYVPLPSIAMLVAAVIPIDWYRLVSAGAVTLRRSDVDSTGDLRGPAWCNGCVACDAMLTDQPIQAAFAELIPIDRNLQTFVLDTIDFPETELMQAFQLP